MAILGINLFQILRIWLATLVAGFPAGLTCVLLAIGLMGREDNPLIQLFILYGLPGILFFAPLILTPLVISGRLNQDNWVIVIASAGGVLVAALGTAAWFGNPLEVSVFQRVFGEGTSGNMMGAFAQASVAVPSLAVYGVTFWLTLGQLNKRFPIKSGTR